MDIIANDPGGSAGSWGGLRLPRWTRAAAFGTAAVCLLGYVATHRFASPQDPPSGWVASTQPAASGPATALTGRSGYGPLGLRILVGGTDPRVVDLDTGGEHPLIGIPRPAGSTVYVSTVHGALLASVADSGRVSAYLVRAGQPARQLTPGGFALPGADARTVVVFDFRRFDAGTTVSGRGLDGRRLWQWRSAEPVLPVRDTAAGLLLRRPDGGAGDMVLVRRETGQVLRRFSGDPVAQGADSIVSADPACRPRCVLVRTRLDTGATTRFPLRGRVTPDAGMISPDGRWLALAFRAGVGENNTTVAVMDLRTGAVWPVPGVWAPGPLGGRQATLAWSDDAQSLVVAVPVGTDSVRLGIWRPDAPLEPVTVLPRPFTGAPLGLVALP